MNAEFQRIKDRFFYRIFACWIKKAFEDSKAFSLVNQSS